MKLRLRDINVNMVFLQLQHQVSCKGSSQLDAQLILTIQATLSVIAYRTPRLEDRATPEYEEGVSVRGNTPQSPAPAFFPTLEPALESAHAIASCPDPSIRHEEWDNLSLFSHPLSDPFLCIRPRWGQERASYSDLMPTMRLSPRDRRRRMG